MPRWTRGAGAGGRWKQSPGDFYVEEVSLQPPEGRGEHQWLWVEKINFSTEEVAELLARHAAIRRSDVGYAGLKDRFACTRQVFTLHGGRAIADLAPDALPPGIRVLRADRCLHKLRIGALAGNRFRIRLEGVHLPTLHARLDDLAETGVPNYYGVQRVGGDAPALGYDLLLDRVPEPPHTRLRFALSAWQSLLFNDVLALRGPRRMSGDLLDGDGPGAIPTGPIFGHSMPWPAGEALELEESILLQQNLPAHALTRWPDLTRGARRPLWFTLDAGLEPAPGGVWLHLRLPPGSYATTVLEELL